MRKLVVDIDNTLWDLASVLYERISRVNPAMISPMDWREFDFWKKFVSARVFYQTIRDIHLDQCLFTPYPDAENFLRSVRDMGFYLVIASHREKGTLDTTERWLRDNNLVFDEIHLSYDKTVLFQDCWGIVDDSPVTLEKAKKAGIVATGLEMPWNEQGGYHLFGNLVEVL
jgi:hypothetical protein